MINCTNVWHVNKCFKKKVDSAELSYVDQTHLLVDSITKKKPVLKSGRGALALVT